MISAGRGHIRHVALLQNDCPASHTVFAPRPAFPVPVLLCPLLASFDAPCPTALQVPVQYQPPSELYCVKATYRLINPSNVSVRAAARRERQRERDENKPLSA